MIQGIYHFMMVIETLIIVAIIAKFFKTKNDFRFYTTVWCKVD